MATLQQIFEEIAKDYDQVPEEISVPQEIKPYCRYHAVKKSEISAICGAKPGRRSVGWSPTPKANSVVTCPRCLKKLEKVHS
jgi:hypothetical protein